jgi:hypothetical protein
MPRRTVNDRHRSVAVSLSRVYRRWLMPSSSTFLRLAFVAVATVAVLGVASGSALAAYPPTNPPVKGKCFISTIVERRVAVSCSAPKANAGKSCSLVIKKVVVARGKLNKNGKWLARFFARTLLTRGTTITFRVQGAAAAIIRV